MCDRGDNHGSDLVVLFLLADKDFHMRNLWLGQRLHEWHGSREHFVIAADLLLEEGSETLNVGAHHFLDLSKHNYQGSQLATVLRRLSMHIYRTASGCTLARLLPCDLGTVCLNFAHLSLEIAAEFLQTASCRTKRQETKRSGYLPPTETTARK